MMNRMTFTDQATKYTRISKARARQMFKSGKPLHMIACKMRPGMPFEMGMTIDSARRIEDLTDSYRFHHVFSNENYRPLNKYWDYPESEIADRAFDKMIRDFAWYNCTYETGYYPAFYVLAGI